MAIQNRVPTSDVAGGGWVALGGGDSYVEVDDPVGTPDDDTTYIYSTSTTAVEYFEYLDFVITSSAIASITVYGRAKYIGSGDYRFRVQVNGVIYTGSIHTLTASYANYSTQWLTNPNTGLAWVETDVEGTGAAPLQYFGVRRANVGEVRCTQNYIEVDYTEAGGGLSIPIAMFHYQHHIGSGV